MKLAKILKKKPTIIAQDILNAIEFDETIEKIEVAPPGYINFFLSNQNKYQVINEILDQKDIYTKQIENLKKYMLSMSQRIQWDLYMLVMVEE